MAGLDSNSIILVVLPFILYVGYSELTRNRRREEEKTDKHRRELKDEANDKLRNVYGPLLYRLDVAANDRTREKSRTGECRYVLTRFEIDKISGILAANHHLVADQVLNCWELRFEGAKFTQWNATEGTGGVDLTTGFACNLSRLWQRTKAEYDRLMKQYEDNKN